VVSLLRYGVATQGGQMSTDLLVFLLVWVFPVAVGVWAAWPRAVDSYRRTLEHRP
jgi:hypothetical protein